MKKRRPFTVVGRTLKEKENPDDSNRSRGTPNAKAQNKKKHERL
jgi:hypothetical protein